MSDTINRQAAIDVVSKACEECRGIFARCEEYLLALPSAEPEISRIEQELHGKTPEEQYEFLYWLLFKFALTYTDSRLAVVEWLRGEEE